MDSSSALNTSLIGVIVGSSGAAARWFSEIMQGRARWVAAHFIFIIVMGGFMGFMGDAIAQATGRPQWANVLSGALGASGAFGIEFFVARILGMVGR